jgi:hypothetical protein
MINLFWSFSDSFYFPGFLLPIIMGDSIFLEFHVFLECMFFLDFYDFPKIKELREWASIFKLQVLYFLIHPFCREFSIEF